MIDIEPNDIPILNETTVEKKQISMGEYVKELINVAK